MMNTKIRDVIFFLIVFCLIFNGSDVVKPLNFIKGPMYWQITFFPTFIGVWYTLYCHFKYKNVFYKRDVFLKFMLLFTVFLGVAYTLGAYYYPYYDVVTSSLIAKSDKLNLVLSFLYNHNVAINKVNFLKGWFHVLNIKTILLELFYTFGVSYMVFCWYHRDWQNGFKVLIKAILCTCVVMILYSSIEIPYLAGSGKAKEILIQITPYFHDIKRGGNWHPPLLWINGLRSVFSEASYYGIYAAFIMPFIWYKICSTKNKSKYMYIALSCLLTFMIYITNARTAVMLHFGEIGILIIFSIIYLRRNLWKPTAIICACSLAMFMANVAFMDSFVYPKKQSVVVSANIAKKPKSSPPDAIQSKTAGKADASSNARKPKSSQPAAIQSKTAGKADASSNAKKTDKLVETKKFDLNVSKYVDHNIGSLTSRNKRSNGMRYGTMISEIKVGMNNPIFGVGSELRTLYMLDSFPKDSLKNAEYQMCLRNLQKSGFLRGRYPKLGEFTSRFAETGLVGLFLYLVPAFFLMYQLWRHIRNESSVEYIKYLMVLIALVGSLVGGTGDRLTQLYCYWILLGLGYAMVEDEA